MWRRPAAGRVYPAVFLSVFRVFFPVFLFRSIFSVLSLLNNCSQLFFAHTILRELRALLSVPSALNPSFVFSRTHLLPSIRPNHHAPSHQRPRRDNATRRNHQPRQPLAQGIPHRPPRRPAIRIRTPRWRTPPPARTRPPAPPTHS